MLVTRQYFGRDAATGEHELITLSNGRGLTAAVTTYGAQLVSLKCPDAAGKEAEVTLNYRSLKDIVDKNKEYLGVTVGRYANRVARGKFEIDGTSYTLATNDGPNHLHGGTVGFHQRAWRADARCGEHSASVVFHYTSPDGEEGYPGTLNVSAEYTLTDENQLILRYNATTDKPTIVNLCNHAYWNLSGDFARDILGHRLRLAAGKYVPQDEHGTTTDGALAPVAGTPFDFTTEHVVGDRIPAVGITPPGYDHCYVLDGGSAGAAGGSGVLATPGLAFAARLSDPLSGRVMEVHTTKPGLQLYTGNFLKDAPPFSRHSALCLETQFFPDSVNWREWPSPVLRPGQKYEHTTVHSFSTAGAK